MSSVEDLVALRRLADLYCSAVDDGDAKRMASLFADGGELVVYAPGARPGKGEPLRRWGGAENFERLLTTLEQNYVRWVHFLGNHWAEVNGDQAFGEAYLLACHLRGGEGAQEEEVAVIRYVDRYVRVDGNWRFGQRNACRQWTTVRPVSTSRHAIDTALRESPPA